MTIQKLEAYKPGQDIPEMPEAASNKLEDAEFAATKPVTKQRTSWFGLITPTVLNRIGGGRRAEEPKPRNMRTSMRDESVDLYVKERR